MDQGGDDDGKKTDDSPDDDDGCESNQKVHGCLHPPQGRRDVDVAMKETLLQAENCHDGNFNDKRRIAIASSARGGVSRCSSDFQ